MSDNPELLLTAEQAHARYRRDARFAAMTNSVVAHVMHSHGRVDPERADRDAHDIAQKVAAMVLESVFQNDAELHAQRQLADHYRKFAEESAGLRPMPMLIMGRAHNARIPQHKPGTDAPDAQDVVGDARE